MRKFVSFIVLYLVTAAAFAAECSPISPDWPGCNNTLPSPPDTTIPEPEVLSLLGIGALAFLVAHRRKK